MNLIVTGATSFLGTALVRRLLRQGHQIYAVVRPNSPNRTRFEHEIAAVLPGSGGKAALHILELDMERSDRLPQMISASCQVFIHLGWDGAGSDNRKNARVQRKNVQDSMKALEAARKLGCRKFLFSGSQAEYGLCQSVMTEETECVPVSEYGKAKLEFYRQAIRQVAVWNEQAAAGASDCQPEKPGNRFLMEYIHTRIFSIYGPGDHPGSLVSTCLQTFREGGRMELGDCDQMWNYLYIDDLTEGLAALALSGKPVGYTGITDGVRQPESGIYNLAGSETATRPLKDYVEDIRRLCGGRGICLYGQLPPNAEGQAQLIPDIGKIRLAVGWEPNISFEKGIKHMIETGRRDYCIICGHRLPDKPLMVLDGMPASAQDIPGAEQVDQDRGIRLRLCQCGSCGLVQFDCGPVGYYRDVIRSGGYSTTMAELRTSQYRHLIETYHLEGRKFLEVGCGRGEFLKFLTGFPVKAYGIEHCEDLVETARREGLQVFKGFTEKEDTILGTEGPYDVFLSFNFLEHQPEPGVMLDCIRNNLSDGGIGLITVPSLEYILQYDGYYELIRDHIAYYTFDTLRYLLERHGFQVLEEDMVNRDTLSVIVKKREPIDISGLSDSYGRIRKQIEELMADIERRNKKLAVWGASHQGFTLAATTCLGKCAAYMIDSAPFKQGRFAPASHLPIVAPEHFFQEPADAILIVAPGYTEEIAGVIRQRFGGKVEIMTLRTDCVEKL